MRERRQPGGGGCGEEGTGDTGEGHLNTGEINTKESRYVILAEALQGVGCLKKALVLFL